MCSVWPRNPASLAAARLPFELHPLGDDVGRRASGDDAEVGGRLGVDAAEAHVREGAGDGDEGVDPLLGGDAGVRRACR